MPALATLQTTLACVLAGVHFARPAKGLGASLVVRNATVDDVEHARADVVEPDVGESVDCVADLHIKGDTQLVSKKAPTDVKSCSAVQVFVSIKQPRSFMSRPIRVEALTSAPEIKHIGSPSSPMMSSIAASFSWSDVRATECSASIAVSVSVELVKTMPTIIVTSSSGPCCLGVEEDEDEVVEFVFEESVVSGSTTPQFTATYAAEALADISEDEDNEESDVLAAATEAEHARELGQEQAVFGTFDYLRRLRGQEGPMNLCHAMDAIYATLSPASALATVPSLATVPPVVSYSLMSDEAKVVVPLPTMSAPIPATSTVPVPVNVGSAAIADDLETMSATVSFSVSYETISDETESTVVASVSSATDLYGKITTAIDGGGDLDAILQTLAA